MVFVEMLGKNTVTVFLYSFYQNARSRWKFRRPVLQYDGGTVAGQIIEGTRHAAQSAKFTPGKNSMPVRLTNSA
jgi:hypothetical protein